LYKFSQPVNLCSKRFREPRLRRKTIAGSALSTTEWVTKPAGTQPGLLNLYVFQQSPLWIDLFQRR